MTRNEQGEKLHVTVPLPDEDVRKLTDLAFDFADQAGVDIQDDDTCDPLSISVSTAVLLFYEYSKAGTSLKDLSLHGFLPTERVGMKRYSLTLEVNPNAA